MTRIANLSASEHLLGILARTQSRVQDLQTQDATGKRSQTYTGIAGNASELLGLEKGRQMLDRFHRNNDSMKTGLDATTTVVDGIGEHSGHCARHLFLRRQESRWTRSGRAICNRRRSG